MYLKSAPPGLRPGPNLEVTVTYTSCYLEDCYIEKKNVGREGEMENAWF